MTTPLKGMPELTEAQANPEITHNTALRYIDALMQPVVLDKDLTEPPGSPTDGMCHIVASTPSSGSDWDEAEIDDIAYYQNTAWIFITPNEGWRVYVLDEATLYEYQGSSGWVAVSTTIGANAYDIGAYRNGKPGSSEVVLRIPFVRAVDFPDDFSGSKGVAGTDPAHSSGADYDIKKNGVSVGTMSFAGGATTATFVTSGGATSFVVGDYLEVVAPSSQDADLAGVGFVLKGTKA